MYEKKEKYNGEFKIVVVEDIKNNNLSFCEAERKYKIPRSVLIKWERIYLEEGCEGLIKERRGRSCKLDNPNIGRPKKLSKCVEEDLISENQRLRMEIDYLKKLNALVQEKEISARKTKLK